MAAAIGHTVPGKMRRGGGRPRPEGKAQILILMEPGQSLGKRAGIGWRHDQSGFSLARDPAPAHRCHDQRQAMGGRLIGHLGAAFLEGGKDKNIRLSVNLLNVAQMTEETDRLGHRAKDAFPLVGWGKPGFESARKPQLCRQACLPPGLHQDMGAFAYPDAAHEEKPQGPVADGATPGGRGGR